MSYYETERDKAIIASLKEIGSQLKQINEAISKEQSERYLVKENGEVVPLTPKTEWIIVDERLPEPQKLVLCIWERVDDGWNYGFARYQREDVWYVSNEGMPRVTHWMPLPEPPKMKGGAE